MILSVVLSGLATPADAGRIQFCFLFCGVEVDVVDSFCKTYEPVIQGTGEGKIIGRTGPVIRRRIDRNEALYRCKCEKWDDPICDKLDE